jgi:hypothetical protein
MVPDRRNTGTTGARLKGHMCADLAGEMGRGDIYGIGGAAARLGG